MAFLYSIVTIFGMAALAGMYLLSLILRNKETPKGFSLIHGAMAFVAVVLLVFYCAWWDSSPARSLVIFIIAAVGGIALFYRDLTGKSVPKWFALAHGLIAITGFVFLLCDAF